MPLVEAGWIDKETKKGFPLALVVHGPTVDVTVGWLSGQEGDDAPDVESVKALVDTGATESCIDDKLAQQLTLPVVDVIRISGAGGVREHNVYVAEVTIPGLAFKQLGRFAGVHLKDGEQMHDVLLGRTFLQDMVMIYDGRRGHVTIAR